MARPSLEQIQKRTIDRIGRRVLKEFFVQRNEENLSKERRVKSKIKRLLRFLGYLYIKRKLIFALIIVIKSYFQVMQAFFLNS